MDAAKVKEVIARYRDFFEIEHISKNDFPHDELPDPSFDYTAGENVLSHCHGMLDKMEKFLEEGRLEKTFRWLGFVQGCLWTMGQLTLQELMDHNKSEEKTA